MLFFRSNPIAIGLGEILTSRTRVHNFLKILESYKKREGIEGVKEVKIPYYILKSTHV